MDYLLTRTDTTEEWLLKTLCKRDAYILSRDPFTGLFFYAIINKYGDLYELMAERVGPTQIQNRKFSSTSRFQVLILQRSPGVAYFCNQANIPDISLGVATQPNYLRDIPTPGDKMDFGDLSLRFLVDEDLTNYMEIQKWMRGLGFPESLQEFEKFEKDGRNRLPRRYAQFGDQIYSDGTLQILSSNLVAKFNVNFTELFPYSLSTLAFDATDTDIEYFTAEVNFKYTMYNLTDIANNPL